MCENGIAQVRIRQARQDGHLYHGHDRSVNGSVLERASVDVVMCLIAACRPVHHPQHVDAAGRDGPPHQKSRDEKKSNIEPRRVIPRDGRLDDARLMLAGDETKDAEQSFDNNGSDGHRDIECDEQERGHLQPVVLAVDVEDRQHDQVGEDEGDHAAEADAPVPQHRGKRDVPDAPTPEALRPKPP
jgi:hypothetical protein